jgi:hypothetical protein
MNPEQEQVFLRVCCIRPYHCNICFFAFNQHCAFQITHLLTTESFLKSYQSLNNFVAFCGIRSAIRHIVCNRTHYLSLTEKERAQVFSFTLSLIKNHFNVTLPNTHSSSDGSRSQIKLHKPLSYFSCLLHVSPFLFPWFDSPNYKRTIYKAPHCAVFCSLHFPDRSQLPLQL